MVEVSYWETLHNCKYCGLEYRRTPAYIKHLIEFHNADLPKCSFCQKQFLSNKDLQEHVDDMHTADGGDKRHKCSRCTCTFKWLKDLKNHLARKHGPNAKPVLQCRYCGLQLYQRAEYTEHVLGVHWKRQIFQCEICSYKFKYRNKLIKHIQILHGSLAQWKKCNFCPASYKWTRDLERHYQQKHRALRMKTTQTSDPISYKCDVCSQCFHSKENLIGHLNDFHQSSEGTSNYLQKCSHCSEGFKTRKLLSQHSLVHDIEFLHRETSKTTDRTDQLIIVPDTFPENIVDFEVELRKRWEFRDLIEVRENIVENVNDRSIEFGSRSLNEDNLANDVDLILSTSTAVKNIEKSKETHESNFDVNVDKFVRHTDDRLHEHSNYTDRFELKDLKIVFVRLEDDIKEKAKGVDNVINESTLLSSTTNKSTNAIENTSIDCLPNICREPFVNEPETNLKNDNFEANAKHLKQKLKDIRIILVRIEDEKSLILKESQIHSKLLEDSTKTSTNTLNDHSSKQSNVDEHTYINKKLVSNVNNEHKISRFHSCQQCSKKFRVKESLNHHISEDHNNGKILMTHKCQICDADFPYRYYLRLHLKGEHLVVRKKKQIARTILTCKFCKMRFKTKHSYNNHLKNNHLKTGQKSLCCRTCNKVCNNRRTLIRHYRLEHSRMHKCWQCSSVFDSKDLLREHEQQMHSIAPCYRCKLCTAIYTRKVRLEEHIQLEHRNGLGNNLMETSRVKEINRVGGVKIQRKENRLKALKSNLQRQCTIKIRPFQMTVKQSNIGIRRDINDRNKHKGGIKRTSTDKHRPRKQQIIKYYGNQFQRKRTCKADKTIKVDHNLKSVRETQVNEDNILADNSPAGQHSLQNQTNPAKSDGRRKSILKLKEIFYDNEILIKRRDVSKRKSVSFQLDEMSFQTNNDFDSIDEVNEKHRDEDQQMREAQKLHDNMNSDLADNTGGDAVDFLSDNVAEEVSGEQDDEYIDSYCRQDTLTSDLDQLLEESSMICTDMEDVAIIYDNSKEMHLKNKRRGAVHLKKKFAKHDFKCEMCHAIFESKKLLSAHVRNHDKVHKCFVCHSMFKRRGDLTRHCMKKHKVSIFENNPMGDLNHVLGDHSYCMRVTNKKTIVENIATCENQLNIPQSEGNIKNHQYKCNYCVSIFSFPEKLQRHMKQFHKITSKVGMHWCYTCKIVFNSQEHLYVHEKLIHAVAPIEDSINNEAALDQGEDATSGKRFKWKKALAQTYESETV